MDEEAIVIQLNEWKPKHKFMLAYYPHLKDKNDFVRGLTGNKRQLGENMLRFQNSSIPTSLTHIKDKKISDMATDLFDLLLETIGISFDQDARKPHEAAIEVINRGEMYSDLRNELFVQIMKQQRSNTDSKSARTMGNLLYAALARFDPDPNLMPFVQYHLAGIALRKGKISAPFDQDDESHIAVRCFMQMFDDTKKLLDNEDIIQMFGAKNTGKRIITVDLYGVESEELIPPFDQRTILEVSDVMCSEKKFNKEVWFSFGMRLETQPELEDEQANVPHWITFEQLFKYLDHLEMLLEVKFSIALRHEKLMYGPVDFTPDQWTDDYASFMFAKMSDDILKEAITVENEGDLVQLCALYTVLYDGELCPSKTKISDYLPYLLPEKFRQDQDGSWLMKWTVEVHTVAQTLVGTMEDLRLQFFNLVTKQEMYGVSTFDVNIEEVSNLDDAVTSCVLRILPSAFVFMTESNETLWKDAFSANIKISTKRNPRKSSEFSMTFKNADTKTSLRFNNRDVYKILMLVDSFNHTEDRAQVVW